MLSTYFCEVVNKVYNCLSNPRIAIGLKQKKYSHETHFKPAAAYGHCHLLICPNPRKDHG